MEVKNNKKTTLSKLIQINLLKKLRKETIHYQGLKT